MKATYCDIRYPWLVPRLQRLIYLKFKLVTMKTDEGKYVEQIPVLLGKFLQEG